MIYIILDTHSTEYTWQAFYIFNASDKSVSWYWDSVMRKQTKMNFGS